MRRVNAVRRPGRGLGWGGSSYSPLKDPGLVLVEWWTARAGLELSGSLATTQAGQKNGWTLDGSGAARPSYSATGITDAYGGTHPALVYAGAQAQQCVAAGLAAAMTPLTTATLLIGFQKTATGTACLTEWGPSFSVADGRWGVFLDDTNNDSIEVGARSTGSGVWRGDAGAQPFYDPDVIQINLFGGVDGSTLREIDGVTALGSAVLSAFSAPRNFSSETLYVGGRTASSLFISGAISDYMIINLASSTAAAIARARRYIGSQIGAPQA